MCIDLNSKETVNNHLNAAASWIYRSYLANEKVGSSAFYSRVYHPFKGWELAYPETTGYIIPTLFKYSIRNRESKYFDLGLSLAEWILSLQYEDGSLPGGFFCGKKEDPSVFNTAQMIFGLISAYHMTEKNKFLNGAISAAKWLADVQDNDGQWTKYSYKQGFSPSYYSRVAWPMLEVWKETKENKIKEKAISGLKLIAKRQKRNNAISSWGFEPNESAFTHTIAYTIRGFLESALIIQDKEMWETGFKPALKLLRMCEIKGKLAGRYDENWNPDYRFICLTGNCQIAFCWYLIYKKTNDVRFLNVAIKAIKPVIESQVMNPKSQNYGAIPGSKPIWGRYLIFRYPNWAVKFYMDVLMAISDELIQLKEI